MKNNLVELVRQELENEPLIVYYDRQITLGPYLQQYLLQQAQLSSRRGATSKCKRIKKKVLKDQFTSVLLDFIGDHSE